MRKTAPKDDGLSRYVPVLRAYFRRRAHPADVEDLAQEVLLSMQARVSLEPIENVDGYVFTIASHVLSKHLARDRRASDVVVHLGHVETSQDDLSPERQALARAELDQARRAILKLPDRTRSIFIAHRFEHETYAEIAVRFGLSVSAVEKHIMKAMRALLATRGWA